MQLRDWQAAVQASVLSTDPAPRERVMAWLRNEAADSGGPGPAVRLDVYINAYALRLAEALRTNYPALHQLLGDEDFDTLASRYLDAHPSAHASIRWFGDRLAAFLREAAPYATVPAMAELAEFEWALRHTIDAADAELLTPDRLQALDPGAWGDLTFALHPSLRILALNWNAPQIWRALEHHENPPAPVAQAGTWLVYRQPDLVSGWRSAPALEAAALEIIASGHSFADLCEALCDLADDVDTVPLTAATLLRQWVAQGLLALRAAIPQEPMQ
ncbi:MAG: DNA-binding domain-containing protein [Halioglobus sp.]